MRRLLCTCITLTALACSPTDAGKDAGKVAPAKPAEAATVPANPHGAMPVDPHADPHATGTPTPAAPKVRPPVNPQPVTPSGELRSETVEGLVFSVPTEWTRKPGSNEMRLAEFILPGPGGEVTLIVSRFKGGGGDAASNVNRWKAQFVTAEGAPQTEAKVQTALRPPLTITRVDITGTNVAPVMPGSPDLYREPNSRMFGVIVEGAGDPYFFKAVGAGDTLAVWEPAFAAFADSIAPPPAG
ncbi:MAG: hypothetical protein H0T76_23205 [Nannocystis sp.]|nr:hypothetical protein [Nannocystis sp.]MBA3549393.1 hypothetical protein [Nannocystis sp.]